MRFDSSDLRGIQENGTTVWSNSFNCKLIGRFSDIDYTRTVCMAFLACASSCLLAVRKDPFEVKIRPRYLYSFVISIFSLLNLKLKDSGFQQPKIILFGLLKFTFNFRCLQYVSKYFSLFGKSLVDSPNRIVSSACKSTSGF